MYWGYFSFIELGSLVEVIANFNQHFYGELQVLPFALHLSDK